jgi:hypothetical protein
VGMADEELKPPLSPALMPYGADDGPAGTTWLHPVHAGVAACRDAWSTSGQDCRRVPCFRVGDDHRQRSFFACSFVGIDVSIPHIAGAGGGGAGEGMGEGEEDEEEDDLARLEHQRARIVAAQKRVMEGKTAEEAPAEPTRACVKHLLHAVSVAYNPSHTHRTDTQTHTRFLSLPWPCVGALPPPRQCPCYIKRAPMQCCVCCPTPALPSPFLCFVMSPFRRRVFLALLLPHACMYLCMSTSRGRQRGGGRDVRGGGQEGHGG